MTQANFIVQCLQRTVDQIVKDAWTSVATADELANFINNFADKFPNKRSAIVEFASKTRVQLPIKLLEQLYSSLVPETLRVEALSLVQQHEELGRQKEAAVRRQDFQIAAEHLSHQRGIAASLRQKLAGKNLLLDSKHLQAALRSLGFDA